MPAVLHARLLALLQTLRQQHAHALILASGRAAVLDTGTDFLTLPNEMWSAADVEQLLARMPGVLGTPGRHCVEMEGVGRVAISALHGHGGWMATLRPVLPKAPAWKDLGLPARVAAWPDFTSGLLVVASAAGHGKTTTVASLVDAWTQQHARHVVMFQQPVEVVHHAHKGVVTQVEVALDHVRIVDTLALVKHSQAHAVVLDLKDPGHTVTAALELAMASTLTVVTLDVQSVTDVVRRLLLEHPGHAQQAVRRWLQTHLRGVLVQRWKTPARQEMEFEWAVQSPVLEEMLRGEVVKELAAAVRPSELPDVAQAFPS